MTTTIDGQVARRGRSRSLPWTVWALLGGAFVNLLVQLLPDWYSVFGPYFLADGDMVIGWIRAVAPFLLAASVIVGADRWPAGRRHLRFAAGALAMFAVLSLVHDAWWAVWEMNPGEIPATVQPWLIAREVGAGVVVLVAYGLMALGLWLGSARPLSRGRLLTMAGIGALALAVTAVGLWTLTLYRAPDGGTLTAATVIASGVLTPLGFVALGAVGIAAIRAMPEQESVPELLIAVGATLAMAGAAWSWSFWALIPQPDVAPEVVALLASVPGAAVAIGMVAMVGGFVAAALVRRPAINDPRTES